MGSNNNANGEVTLSPQPLPKHVALSTTSTELRNVLEIVQSSVALRIPIITFKFVEDHDSLLNLLTALVHWDFLEKNQVKVSVIGKWYDLPERLIEPIKQLIEATKDYDAHFLNLCIKYDGQEEIVDACKILAKQVKLGKLSPEGINKSAIKENIYASYFLPPDLIILPGTHTTSGLLLWDSPNAIVHHAPQKPEDYTKTSFLASIKFFQDSHRPVNVK